MNAADFAPGQVVSYLGVIRAEVIGTRRNGVLIGHWGRGLQEGKYIKRRVAARDLSTPSKK
jgi:hypothetical protein